MINDDLFDTILLNPVSDLNVDKIVVISGYASSAMAYKHFNKLNGLNGSVCVDLLIGMAKSDGIGKGAHGGYKKLSVDYPGRFKCSYYVGDIPIHSKSYIWLRNDKPICAFTGSANYSQRAFFQKTQEAMVGDDPSECFNYFNHALENSINCLDSEIEEHITLYNEVRARKTVPALVKNGEEYDFNDELKHVTISLLTNSGQLPQSSGLNWGQRKGREPNQAYIRVPSQIAQMHFFPPRAQHFTLITDDGESFDCATAQDGEKAIHTTYSNSIFGRYFRRRLGVNDGDLIGTGDIARYGRSDVKIYMIDDETYYMDFSV